MKRLNALAGGKIGFGNIFSNLLQDMSSLDRSASVTMGLAKCGTICEAVTPMSVVRC